MLAEILRDEQTAKQLFQAPSKSKVKQAIAAFIDLFVLFTSTEIVIMLQFSLMEEIRWSLWRREWSGGPVLPRQAYWWHKILDFLCLFCFNWRIIALQYCVSFCHTSTCISHRYTHVPSLWNLLPTSQPIPPTSRLSQSTRFELPVSHSKFLLAIYLTYGNV